jgi:hypothetical protein
MWAARRRVAGDLPEFGPAECDRRGVIRRRGVLRAQGALSGNHACIPLPEQTMSGSPIVTRPPSRRSRRMGRTAVPGCALVVLVGSGGERRGADGLVADRLVADRLVADGWSRSVPRRGQTVHGPLPALSSLIGRGQRGSGGGGRVVVHPRDAHP